MKNIVKIVASIAAMLAILVFIGAVCLDVTKLIVFAVGCLVLAVVAAVFGLLFYDSSTNQLIALISGFISILWSCDMVPRMLEIATEMAEKAVSGMFGF